MWSEQINGECFEDLGTSPWGLLDIDGVPCMLYATSCAFLFTRLFNIAKGKG